jgi:phage baseplate assembly protein W
MPDFGSDLKKYIFEPNDNITHDQIKNNLNETINRYIPNLTIDSILFEKHEIEEVIIVKLSYTVTENAFTSSDTIELTL